MYSPLFLIKRLHLTVYDRHFMIQRAFLNSEGTTSSLWYIYTCSYTILDFYSVMCRFMRQRQ